MQKREQGIVKTFNAVQGCGLIRRSGGTDVYVHFSAIRGEGYRELEEGERVEFSVVQGPGGLQAEDIVVLG